MNNTRLPHTSAVNAPCTQLEHSIVSSDQYICMLLFILCRFYLVPLHTIIPNARKIIAQFRTVHDTSAQKVPSVLLSILSFCFWECVKFIYIKYQPMHSKYTPNTHKYKLQADRICPFCSREKCTKSNNTKIWPIHTLCTPNTRLCKLQSDNICPSFCSQPLKCYHFGLCDMAQSI